MNFSLMASAALRLTESPGKPQQDRIVANCDEMAHGGLRWSVWIGRIGRLSPDVAGPPTQISGQVLANVTLNSAKWAGKQSRTDGRVHTTCLSVRVPALFAAPLTLSR